MSVVCEISGRKPMKGHKVSHSNRKTKRWFNPNLHSKSFYIPEEDKWVTLKVSSAALRTINKKGIFACVQEARKQGYLKK